MSNSTSHSAATAARRCRTVARHLAAATSDNAARPETEMRGTACAAATSNANSTKAPGRTDLTIAHFPYVLHSHVRFGDCDMYQHVHNVSYYAWIDTLVNGYLLTHGGMVMSEVVGLVVSSSCQYMASIEFPQRLLLGLRVKALGKTSCTYEMGVFKATGEAEGTATPVPGTESTGAAIGEASPICALGSFTHVFAARHNMRPTDIPASIRAALLKIMMPSCAATLALATPTPAPASASARPQSARRVLMVAPRHFAFNEESAADNAFMHTSGLSTAEISRRAMLEFETYVAAIRAVGVEVEAMEPSSTPAPDGVYPNNWFSTHVADGANPSKLVLYPMRHPSRRRERDANLISILRTRYGQFVDFSSEETRGVIFEGTGAAIIDHVNRILYHSISERASPALAKRVAQALWPDTPHRVMSFEAYTEAGTPHYHTNVLFGLGTRWAVLCVDAVPTAQATDLLRSLESTGHEVVRITPKQVTQFCGNVLELQNATGQKFIAMSSQAYHAFTREQRATLERHARLLHSPLETIETIGGGGARCMLAELF